MFYPILSFSFIILYLFAELDLSNNRISMLPGEMTNCTQLESIDISSNSFVTLPPVLAEMPSITKIIARKNYVAELDVEVVASLGNLATLNLEENPLNKTTYEDLERLTSLQILLSPRTMLRAAVMGSLVPWRHMATESVLPAGMKPTLMSGRGNSVPRSFTSSFWSRAVRTSRAVNIWEGGGQTEV